MLWYHLKLSGTNVVEKEPIVVIRGRTMSSIDLELIV